MAARTPETDVGVFKANFKRLIVGLRSAETDMEEQFTVAMSWFNWIKTSGCSQEHMNYFFKHAVPGMAQAVLKREYAVGAVQDILFGQKLVHLALSACANHLKADLVETNEIMQVCLDPSMRLYRIFGKGTLESEEFGIVRGCLQADTGADGLDDSWAELLDAGDEIDFCVDGKWETATIVESSPYGTELRILAPGMEEATWKRATDPDMAPKGKGAVLAAAREAEKPPPPTPGPQDAWRNTLEQGDMLDVMDMYRTWVQGVVLEREVEQDGTVKVLVRAIGYGEKYDDWYDVLSPKLAPLNSLSEGERGYLTKDVVHHDAEFALPEGVALPDGVAPGSAAVRWKGWRRSSYLLDNINYFLGTCKGARGIASRLKSGDPVPLESLFVFLDCMGKIATLLSPVANDFLHALVTGSYSRIASAVSSPEDLDELSGPLLDQLLQALYKVVRRLFSEAQTGETIESLRLRVIGAQLQRGKLQQAVEAAKSLSELLQHLDMRRLAPKGLLVSSWTQADGSVKTNYRRVRIAPSYLTEDIILSWISSEDVLGTLFAKIKHEQSIKASAGLVKFLAKAGRLSSDALDMMLSVALGAATDAATEAVSVLVSTAPFMDDTALQQLFTSTLAAAASGVDDRLVRLLKAVATSGSSADKTPLHASLVSEAEAFLFALAFGPASGEPEGEAPTPHRAAVWSALQALSGSISPDMQEAALVELFQMLCATEGGHIRDSALLLASALFSHGVAPDSALFLLHAALANMPSFSVMPGETSRADAIGELVVATDLVSALVEQVQGLAAGGSKQAPPPRVEWPHFLTLVDAAMAPSTTPLTERLHALVASPVPTAPPASSSTVSCASQAAAARLELLAWLLASSSCELNQEQAIDLWTVAAQASDGTSSLIYGWFMDAVRRLHMSHASLGLDDAAGGAGQESHVFSADVARAVYAAFMEDDTFATSCTLPAFNAVVSLFLLLNELDAKLTLHGGALGLGSCQFGRPTPAGSVPTFLRLAAQHLVQDEGGIRRQSIATLAVFSIDSLDLEGVDAVWQVALAAEDEDASTNAAALLSSLQQRLAAPLAGEAQGMRAQTVAKCIRYMRRAAGMLSGGEESGAGGVPISPQRSEGSTAGSASPQRLLQRCVSMLNGLVQDSVKDAAKGALLRDTAAAAVALAPPLLKGGEPMTLRLTVSEADSVVRVPASSIGALKATPLEEPAADGTVLAKVPLSTKSIDCTAYPHESGLSLLSSIAFLLRVPLSELRVSVTGVAAIRGGALGKTLAELGVTSGASVLVLKPRASEPAEDPEAYLSPEAVLTAVQGSTAAVLAENAECVEALLETLDLMFASQADEAALRHVWHLLCRLPTQSVVASTVGSLGTAPGGSWTKAAFEAADAELSPVALGTAGCFTPPALCTDWAAGLATGGDAASLAPLLSSASPSKAYLTLSCVLRMLGDPESDCRAALALSLRRVSAGEASGALRLGAEPVRAALAEVGAAVTRERALRVQWREAFHASGGVAVLSSALQGFASMAGSSSPYIVSVLQAMALRALLFALADAGHGDAAILAGGAGEALLGVTPAPLLAATPPPRPSVSQGEVDWAALQGLGAGERLTSKTTATPKSAESATMKALAAAAAALTGKTLDDDDDDVDGEEAHHEELSKAWASASTVLPEVLHSTAQLTRSWPRHLPTASDSAGSVPEPVWRAAWETLRQQLSAALCGEGAASTAALAAAVDAAAAAGRIVAAAGASGMAPPLDPRQGSSSEFRAFLLQTLLQSRATTPAAEGARQVAACVVASLAASAPGEWMQSIVGALLPALLEATAPCGFLVTPFRLALHLLSTQTGESALVDTWLAKAVEAVVTCEGVERSTDVNAVVLPLVGRLALLSALLGMSPASCERLAVEELPVAPIGALAGAAVAFAGITGDDKLDEALRPGGLGLVQFLFTTCLFDLPVIGEGEGQAVLAAHAAPKCKTEFSRAAAFAVLKQLAAHSPAAARACMVFVEQLVQDHEEQKVVWRFTPASGSRSATGYVGLRNLGCICYMNALMQQFFMIEPLRYALLAADSKADEQSEEEVKDNLLHQVQVMFGNLDMSAKQAFDPSSWCYAFKDETGKAPTHVLVQQDAQEYLTRFIDRLEFSLKGSKWENLFAATVTGTVQDQLVFLDGAPTRDSGVQPFYAHTLAVRGRSSLAEALAGQIQGETIDGFRDEARDNMEVTVRKRGVFAELPNTLILHLGRFEMNYSTFTSEKLNSRVEFPLDLDMYPYSKEGVAWEEANQGVEEPSPREYVAHPAEYYEYELVGIVVHVGTIDSGHYFSYIRERGVRAHHIAKSRQAACAAGAPASVEWRGEWFEFNDRLVVPWDVSRMEEACFGGTRLRSRWSTSAGCMIEEEVDIMQNAYILVYERKQPQDITMKLPPVDGQPAETLTMAPGDIVPLDASGRGRLPESVELGVSEENCNFLHLCNMFEPSFMEWVTFFTREAMNPGLTTALAASAAPWVEPEMQPSDVDAVLAPCGELAQEVSSADGLSELYTLMRFMILVTAHSADTEPFLRQCAAMEDLVASNVTACKQVLSNLQHKSKLFKDMLGRCPHPEVRAAFASFLLRAFLRLNVLEEGRWAETVDVEVPRMLKAKNAAGKTISIRDPTGATEVVPRLATTCGAFLSWLTSLDMTNYMAGAWKHFNEYFALVYHVALTGRGAREFLFRDREWDISVADFLLGAESPLEGVGKRYAPGRRRRPEMSNKYAAADFSAVWDTIALGVRCRTKLQHKLKGAPMPCTTIIKGSGGILLRAVQGSHPASAIAAELPACLKKAVLSDDSHPTLARDGASSGEQAGLTSGLVPSGAALPKALVAWAKWHIGVAGLEELEAYDREAISTSRGNAERLQAAAQAQEAAGEAADPAHKNVLAADEEALPLMPFPGTSDFLKAVQTEKLWSKALNGAHNRTAVGECAWHLCTDHPSLSLRVEKVLSKAIQEAETPAVRRLFVVLRQMLALNSPEWMSHRRAQTVLLGVPLYAAADDTDTVRVTDEGSLPEGAMVEGSEKTHWVDDAEVWESNFAAAGHKDGLVAHAREFATRYPSFSLEVLVHTLHLAMSHPPLAYALARNAASRSFVEVFLRTYMQRKTAQVFRPPAGMPTGPASLTPEDASSISAAVQSLEPQLGFLAVSEAEAALGLPDALRCQLALDRFEHLMKEWQVPVLGQENMAALTAAATAAGDSSDDGQPVGGVYDGVPHGGMTFLDTPD